MIGRDSVMGGDAMERVFRAHAIRDVDQALLVAATTTRVEVTARAGRR